MRGTRSHLICITLTPAAAEVLETRRSGQAVEALRRSTLLFSPDASLDTPDQLGNALAEHLKQHGYSARHVVVGLCPRWVLLRQKHVPPTDHESLRGIVNLQIEREFVGSAGEMCFDYLIGKPAAEDTQVPLLIAATTQTVLDRVARAIRPTGLAIDAVTPTAFSAIQAEDTGIVALIESGVAGVVLVHRGAVLGLSSCSFEGSALNTPEGQHRLVADITRCTLSLPGVDDSTPLTLVLPASTDPSHVGALRSLAAERFADVRTRSVDVTQLLAEKSMRKGASQIDFFHSRLAPVKPRLVTPTVAWAIRACAAVLLIAFVGGYFWFDASSRRDDLQAELQVLQPTVEELDTIRRNTRLARRWFDDRLPAHEVLLELTRTFPVDGQIRVETLTLQANLLCQIECTAQDRETMDRYYSQIQASPRLKNVDLGGVRPAGGNTTWIDFPLTLRFDPTAKGGQP